MITKIDFLAKCRKLYADKPTPAPGGRFRLLEDVYPFGKPGEEPTLVLAAWLHRLGHQQLAAKVLANVPATDRAAEVGVLRAWLARAAFTRMVESYRSYQDQNALDHGERLLRVYPEQAKELPQARPLVDDLKRRRQQGVLEKKGSPELPKDFGQWDRKKQLSFLLAALDEMDAPVTTAPRVAALLGLGEMAVPALLDVLEKDPRMTRYVEGPDRWARIPKVQSVREVALVLLCRVLRVRHLDPREADVDDNGLSPNDLKKAAVAARAYWKEFGRLPFEVRMLRVLTDRRASFPALREAAKNLSENSDPDETDWPDRVKVRPPWPAVQKLNNPTAAEATLSAMDRDLAHDDTLPEREHNRAYHEPVYFSALIRLGDRRIAPELARRAQVESDALMRLRFAHASHRLGQSLALRAFAKEFGAGKVALALDNDDSPSRWQLEHIIEFFAAVNLPEAHEALFQLGKHNHRYHAATVKGLIERQDVYDSAGSFLDHPYCVRILRELLDDVTVTKTSVSFVGGNFGLRRQGAGYSGSSLTPAILTDPKELKTAATLRRCDMAGEMSMLCAGLPAFHPLLKDADERRAAIKKALDQFQGKWRTLTDAERRAVAGNTYEVRFGPDFRPLGRPATVEDVKGGKAVFHLEGKGKLAEVELPARGIYKNAARPDGLRSTLIVQAEVRPGGEVVYGVLERHAIRVVSAQDFAEVIPLKFVKTNDD